VTVCSTPPGAVPDVGVGRYDRDDVDEVAAMEARPNDKAIGIRLLGCFEVVVGDRLVNGASWPSTRSAQLVQLLALAHGRVLTRDQVIEALWPHLDVDAGAANLRKAAHHARRALDADDAVVLRRGRVALFPGRPIEVDVERFECAAEAALPSNDAEAWRVPAEWYAGDLLPESLYEEWTQEKRGTLRVRYMEVLRHGRQWERLVELEPTDEPAQRELMRAALAAGDRHTALQCYRRLRTALLRDVGVLPDCDTEALYAECVAGFGAAEPMFVGRQLELARASAVLSDGKRTPPSLLLVRGPPGIGKSSFCEELAKVAGQSGWRWVETRPSPGSRPYAGVAALVEQLVSSYRGLFDDVGFRTQMVLAELASLVGRAEDSGRSLTRHQVVGAVQRLLDGGHDTEGVVLVVDDADLVDEATLDVLLQLAVGSAGSMLVVLAYRPERSPQALDRVVGSLARTGRVLTLDLGPLPNDDAAALIIAAAPETPEPSVVDAIVKVAAGNPLFLVELARRIGSDEPVTLRTADMALARFVDLAEPHSTMLGRLALIGGDLDAAEVAALTGSSEEDAFALLDAALHAGVITVSDGRYRFRHELVRQALIERLTPHQRIAVHRDAARRLERSGAAAALIARHWLDGRRPDAAVEWLLIAARQALRLSAFVDALGFVEPLLAQAPDHPEGLFLRASALDALGRGGAPAAYAAAAAAVGDGKSSDIRAKQALAQLKVGDFAGALRTVEHVEPLTLDGRLARALTLSGVAAIGLVDPALATRYAAESRRLALELGDPAAVVEASWANALAAHARGQLRESLRLDVRDTSSLPELAIAVFDGQLCVAQRLLYGAAPYQDVIAFADALAAEADRLGAARGRGFALTLRGEAKLLAGELAGAERDLVEAHRLHRSIAAPTGEAHNLQRRAELALYRGQNDDAARLLSDALQVARESDVGFHLFDRIYGTVITSAVDADAALAAVEEAELAIRGPTETCPGCRITFAVPAAIAAARAGALDKAAAYAGEADTLARLVMQLPAWDAAVDEVNGHLALASGDAESAKDSLRTAARRFRTVGQPLDAARCAAFANR
jgi:DNA-binding SARP family transcriptional activator